jgi:hypothetical protein
VPAGPVETQYAAATGPLRHFWERHSRACRFQFGEFTLRNSVRARKWLIIREKRVHQHTARPLVKIASSKK